MFKLFTDDIRFHKTVIKQKVGDGTKQVVQTVTEVSMLDDKIERARYFLEKRGIVEAKGIYGAPI